MIPFDGSFAAQTAQEFIDHELVERLGAERVSVGENFRFGNRARGDAELLRSQDAFETVVVELVEVDGEIISSTHIRGLVAAGDVGAAARFLGAPFHMRGPVVHGDKRGRTLGFPTANLVPDPRLVVPDHGIYACRAEVDGEPHVAAVNVGVRPTFKTGRGLLVEAFLLDFDRDIYGRELRLDFLERLRGERRFDSVEALVEQMGRDVAETRGSSDGRRRDRGVERMRVVVAHGRAGERRRFREVLAEAGHEVTECACAGDALARCLDWNPDVAVLDDSAGHGVLERIKRHADAFRTAVLLVEAGLPPIGRALDALRRGAQDILVEPVNDAELVMRVQAAGRTKGLQEEMVAQAERLETMLFEDPLTGLTNRRFILTQLGGMVSGARRHGRAADDRGRRHRPLQGGQRPRGHAEGDRVLAAVARRAARPAARRGPARPPRRRGVPRAAARRRQDDGGRGHREAPRQRRMRLRSP